MSRVAIVNADSYDYDEIKTSIETIIENSDFPDVKGKKVLIKPNILSDAEKEKALTTNPTVVEALINITKERGAVKIYCSDSPGLQSPGFSAKVSGIKDVIDRTGALFVDFTKSPREHSVYKNIKVNMAAIIDDVDVVISAAKFKTHALMMSTGCVKNMFGLVPGLNKSPLHLKCPSVEEFSSLIVSIFKESHTDYALLDGVIAMEGAGPANGSPRKVGLLLGSSDAFAVDYAEALIMGYEKKDMPIFLEGMKLSLTDMSSYTYPLLNPEELIIPDYDRIKSRKKNLFSALLLPYLNRFFSFFKVKDRKAPSFENSCVKCRRCIEICPAKALKMGEKHPEINTSSCIRCYCCHEMCPVNAIKIE